MQLAVNSVVKRKGEAEFGLAGGFFRFSDSTDTYGISCNHVLARWNQCNVGDLLTDANGHAAGTLSHWLILKTSGFNLAEFALFKVDPNRQTTWGSFKPAGFAAPALNQTVHFPAAGRTTHGIISDVQHKVAIKRNGVEYKFIRCIQVDAMHTQTFSGHGDSGGAVFMDNLLLGIILGVGLDESKTYIIPFINGILPFVNLKIY